MSANGPVIKLRLTPPARLSIATLLSRTLGYSLSIGILCLPAFADLDIQNSASRKKTGLSTRVILIHGLNHSPDNLKPLANELEKVGVKTTRLRLHGHTSAKDCGSRSNSPLKIWRKQIREEISKAKDERIILAGFSLGALIALDASRAEKSVSGLILFAPPVALTAKASTIRALLPLKLLRMSLPSKAPAHSRVCKNTPLGFYSALFNLKDSLQLVTKTRLNKVSATVFISKADELVDYSRVRRWVKTNKLTNWNVVTVNPKPSNHGNLPAHLLVDRKNVGENAWEKMISDCKKLINKTS